MDENEREGEMMKRGGSTVMSPRHRVPRVFRAKVEVFCQDLWPMVLLYVLVDRGEQIIPKN